MNAKLTLVAACMLFMASTAFSGDVQLEDPDLNGFIYVTHREDGERRDIYIARSHVRHVLVSSDKKGKKPVHEVFIGFRDVKVESGKAFEFDDIDEARSFAREVVLGKLRDKKIPTEQGGARRPATAPESKSEDSEKPKPESEERSQ